MSNGSGYERRVSPDGARLRPLAGERELEARSGFWDLVKPFMLSDVVTIAAGTTTPTFVAASVFGKGHEGVVVAFTCETDGNDFSQSPWWLKTCSRPKQTLPPQDDGVILAGPFKTAVGALATPYGCSGYPIPFGKDAEVGILCVNKAANALQASAFLHGFVWRYDANRDVRRALFEDRASPLWRPGLFAGGESR